MAKTNHSLGQEVIVLRPYADLDPVAGVVSSGTTVNEKLDDIDSSRATFVIVEYPNGKKFWTNPALFYEL